MSDASKFIYQIINELEPYKNREKSSEKTLTRCGP